MKIEIEKRKEQSKIDITLKDGNSLSVVVAENGEIKVTSFIPIVLKPISSNMVKFQLDSE